jgi:hypothetical protein
MGPEDRRLRQFEYYRAEDRHECSLISTRVGALLTTQSLLAAVAAVTYNHPVATGCAPSEVVGVWNW